MIDIKGLRAIRHQSGLVKIETRDQVIAEIPSRDMDVARLLAAAPALRDLAEAVARLNPDAGEIGAGMLAQLVDQARHCITLTQP